MRCAYGYSLCILFQSLNLEHFFDAFQNSELFATLSFPPFQLSAPTQLAPGDFQILQLGLTLLFSSSSEGTDELAISGLLEIAFITWLRSTSTVLFVLEVSVLTFKWWFERERLEGIFNFIISLSHLPDNLFSFIFLITRKSFCEYNESLIVLLLLLLIALSTEALDLEEITF
jgi:hypothetical protein